MPRQVITHKCNKETEIALMQQDMTYMKGKIDELHHKLLGNGKPGLLDEQSKRLADVEKKIIAYGVGISIAVFLLTLFGSRIVTAILG